MILPPAQLTSSGRPVLQPGEVEISLLDKVDLEFSPFGGLAGQQAEAYKHGYAILTNRRLIWVDAGGDAAAATAGGALATYSGAGGGRRAAAVPLSAVVACSKKVQYGIKGAKVRLMLEVYTDRHRQPTPASGFHTNIDLLGLRCRGPAPDTFKVQLEEQVRHAVAADAAAASAQTPRDDGGGGVSQQLDPHLSPLRAGLQARPSPSPAGAVGGGATPAGAIGYQSPAAAVRTGSAAVSPQPDVVRPDPALLESMVEMGFPRNRAARSLVATGNQGAQEAIDYLLAFGDQPGMDDPWDQPAPAAAGGGGGGARAAAGPWAAQPSPASPAALYPPILPSARPSLANAAATPNLLSYMYGMQPPAAPGAAAVSPQHVSVQQQMAGLRPYGHPYGSAPELAAAGSSLASSVAAAAIQAGPSAALNVEDTGPSRAIGVAGIVKREQQKTAESGRAMEQAFKDLSALMTSAATMVALAEKFRGVLAADGSGGAAAAGAPGGGEDPLLMDLETQQQLIALGISSPVTRETAGARYHIELSRQLADFLATPLQRCGGLISLPDVYCLFNRARGTELVSPDDLLQAAKLFGRAGVQGLRLRALASGVLVIQGPQHSEEQVCARIAQLTAPPAQEPAATPGGGGAAAAAAQGPPAPVLGPGLTSSDLALALGGISVAIAAEHLLTAEARGVVCRDDGPEGLRFYRNFFLQDRLPVQAVAAARG